MTTKITFLGTGNAFGHGGRRRSHYLLEGSITVLLDASYDALSGLRSLGKSIADIDAILISHLHPDHYMAIPQFALENYYVIKRESKIPIIGPLQLEETIIQAASAIFDPEIVEHLKNLFVFKEVGVDQVVKFQDLGLLKNAEGSISTLSAIHSGNARMQIISIDGKKIGYTGDSEFDKANFAKLRSCNIVITEASSASHKIPGHTTLEELLLQSYTEKPTIYLSHLGNSVIDKEDTLVAPFVLAYDGLEVIL